MIIKNATQNDSIDIWNWRNDPHSRSMFINSNLVSWDEHSLWFNRLLSNPAHIVYIGSTKENEKVGVCRFDIGPSGDIAEVSINLNPAMRGKGLSQVFLKAATSIFWDNKKINLTAKIKKENAASLKCFEKSGFVVQNEDECFKYYSLFFQ